MRVISVCVFKFEKKWQEKTTLFLQKCFCSFKPTRRVGYKHQSDAAYLRSFSNKNEKVYIVELI